MLFCMFWKFFSSVRFIKRTTCNVNSTNKTNDSLRSFKIQLQRYVIIILSFSCLAIPLHRALKKTALRIVWLKCCVAASSREMRIASEKAVFSRGKSMTRSSLRNLRIVFSWTSLDNCVPNCFSTWQYWERVQEFFSAFINRLVVATVD